jgi:hypothetical protein
MRTYLTRGARQTRQTRVEEFQMIKVEDFRVIIDNAGRPDPQAAAAAVDSCHNVRCIRAR